MEPGDLCDVVAGFRLPIGNGLIGRLPDQSGTKLGKGTTLGHEVVTMKLGPAFVG